MTLVGVVLALLAASCSSSGSDGDNGDGAAGSTDDSLTSDTLDNDTATSEPDDSSATEGVDGPTLDGSASAGDVTDVWTMIEAVDLTPDADRSLFDDMEGDDAGGLLIAGSTTDHEARSYHATVWHSDDGGTTLSRTVLPTLFEGVKSDIADVEFVPADSPVAQNQGITAVAAGSVGHGSGQRAAIWLLRDGSWSQLESDAFLAERREWTNRLSVGPAGELLVLGSTTDDAGDVDPVAWTSVDGLTWSRSPETFDDLDDTTLVDAAVGEAGTVVIGRFIADSLDHSQVFVSADGESWVQSVPDTFVGSGDVLVASVVTRPEGGFVAVGSVGDGNGVYRPASWTSDDGISWSGPSTNFGLNDDGRSASNGLGAERVRHSDGRYLAISSSDFLQHVWESTDGSTWNPVGNIWDAEPDGVDLSGITVSDGVAVTAGQGRIYRLEGGRWTRLTSDDAVVPQPTTVPWANAVAANGNGFLIVGGYQDSRNDQFGRAWSSPDGLEWAEVGNPLVTLGRLEHGPYRDVAAVDDGFLAAAPETTSIATGKGRFGISYLHAFGADGPGLPTLYSDDDARVVTTSVATLADEVVMAGITFDGVTLRPLMVEGTMNDDVFEPLGPSTIDGESLVRFSPVSVPVPNEADREAWSALCSSTDSMVAVLNLDNSSSGSIRFFSRTVDGAWQQAAAAPEVVAAEESNWVNACAYGSDGFLAVGGVRTGSESDGALWRSVDGTEWETVDVPAAIADPAADGWLIDVAVHGENYLMVGTADVDGASVATMWIGSPTTGWTEIPAANNPVDFDVSSVAVDDAGTVVIAGWQDGQLTVVQSTLDRLLATA